MNIPDAPRGYYGDERWHMEGQAELIGSLTTIEVSKTDAGIRSRTMGDIYRNYYESALRFGWWGIPLSNTGYYSTLDDMAVYTMGFLFEKDIRDFIGEESYRKLTKLMRTKKSQQKR